MKIWIAGLALVAGTASAQSTPPGADIYLAPLTIVGDHITVGAPVNITHRKGYDSQPSFTPDGSSILYTSYRDDGQADIWRYDLRDKSTHEVTHTPESEYSPTVMPGGKRFSVVRVEADSTQRLWSFALDGSDPQLVLTNVKPVGYHAWIDDTTLALFVLGKPNTLQIANTRSGTTTIVTTNIGRSVQALPDHRTIWFVAHESQAGWALRGFSAAQAGGAPFPLRLVIASMPSEFPLRLADGRVLVGDGSRLLVWKGGVPAPWSEVANLSQAGVTHISRMAVSPDGRWLAIVGDDAPSR